MKMNRYDGSSFYIGKFLFRKKITEVIEIWC